MMKRLPVFLSVFLCLSSLLISPEQILSQGMDSLHVRQPDSTKIVLDKETVPAAIRSRMHELSIIHPPGFFPREESANTGFWQSETGPQYQRQLFLRRQPIRTRLRPGYPLRFFPEHALSGIGFNKSDTTGYPLRTHILERREEPLVNVAYRKGDYALNDLSISLATDLSDRTHLHLSREGTQYAGVYGIDGVNTEGYYIGVQHQLRDSSRFFYDTFYAKDNLNWTTANPGIQQTGTEFSSWYYHKMEWQKSWSFSTLTSGFNIGSQRLVMNDGNAKTENMELQRGGWINGSTSIFSPFRLDAAYRFTQFQLQGDTGPVRTEWWHRLSMQSQFNLSGVDIAGRAQLLGIYEGSNQDFFLLPFLSATVSPGKLLTLKGSYEHEIAAPPWQWEKGDSSIMNTGIFNRFTELRRGEGTVTVHPLRWLDLDLAVESLRYDHWYTLEQPVDSTNFNAKDNTGSLLGWHVRLRAEPFPWVSLGSAYNSYPFMTQELPEIWSRQMITSWIHLQRFFFQRNLLLHVYAENGFYLSREPVAWQSSLQSVSYQQGLLVPGNQYYLHLYIIGEIGSFTLSASFYNILSEIEYAVNQRLQYPIFFLGVRWQFWN